MVKGVAETDVDLVNGALAGSERAFQELVRRYERPVFSVIVRAVRDPARAEELAQDTFVKAFLKLDTYAPERKFSSWLLAIAHHAAIDEVRRANVRTTPLEEAPQDCLAGKCDQDSPYRVTEQRELAKGLGEAGHHLGPVFAAVIALEFGLDLTLRGVRELRGFQA